MPSWNQALEALEWVRREMMRMNAPDQMRDGIRERGVQKLCAELLKQSNRTNVKGGSRNPSVTR